MITPEQATTNHLIHTVQEAARALAPRITLYGSGGPDVLEVNPEVFSEVLGTRLKVEEAITQKKRLTYGGDANWTTTDGLYTQVAEGWDYEAPIHNQPLQGLETKIAANIDKLLEDATPRDPAAVLEFGGALALSWMRITAQPQYREAIREGRLAMVVSNLSSVAHWSRDAQGYTGVARAMNTAMRAPAWHNESFYYHQQDIDWAQRQQHYLRYVQANALELPHLSVDLPSGVSMPLRGNTGLIHERLAVVHSHVPDLAMASFAELLHERGILYSNAAVHYHLMHGGTEGEKVTLANGETLTLTEEYLKQRRLALVIGSKMLQRQGFVYKPEPQLSYGVFRRQPSTLRRRFLRSYP